MDVGCLIFMSSNHSIYYFSLDILPSKSFCVKYTHVVFFFSNHPTTYKSANLFHFCWKPKKWLWMLWKIYTSEDVIPISLEFFFAKRIVDKNINTSFSLSAYRGSFCNGFTRDEHIQQNSYGAFFSWVLLDICRQFFRKKSVRFLYTGCFRDSSCFSSPLGCVVLNGSHLRAAKPTTLHLPGSQFLSSTCNSRNLWFILSCHSRLPPLPKLRSRVRR